MISDKVKGQFRLKLLYSSVEEGKALRTHLVASGYDVTHDLSLQSMMAAIKADIPHVLIFSLDSLDTSLSHFVEEVLQINSEIQLIAIADLQHTKPLTAYRDFNLFAIVPQGEGLEERLSWEIDHCCETLFRTYQNEKLLEEKKQIIHEHNETKKMFEMAKVELSERFTVADKVKMYQKIESETDLIEVFLRDLHQRMDRPVQSLYLRFVDSANSFVPMYSPSISPQNYQSLGFSLSVDESATLNSLVENKEVPSALQQYLKDTLGWSKPLACWLTSETESIEGLFVFWNDQDLSFSEVENSFQLFHLLFLNLRWQKRSKNFNLHDEQTGLYNREYYFQKLEEEIARARRLERPVSVAKFSIDHYAELEQSYGPQFVKLVFKAVAKALSETSRVHDISCRTEDNQLSVILPHCSRKGAALRSERLRRIIETHSFSKQGVKITLSAGISEYPSLCSRSLDLDASATQALEFIISKGGNKVCLYKPVSTFKPDFEVSQI